MRLTYDDILSLSEGENERTVTLSSFSINLILSLLRPPEEIFYWRDLTQAERDELDGIVTTAQLEVLTEVVCETARDTMPLGIIIPHCRANVPENYVLCDGSLLDPSEYPDLWNEIDAAYKVDLLGVQYIALPDMRSRVPIGYESPAWPTGYQGGEAAHQLTHNEMPEHVHDIALGSGSAGTVSWIAATASARAFSRLQATENEGRGVAHNNMPPFHVVPGWIMKAKHDVAPE